MTEDLAALEVEELEEEVIFTEWRLLRHESSRSLGRTRQLMDILGYDPQTPGHWMLGVVGSKGKGTATAYASAALCGVGVRTGTVMSPGILSNADRIRVDGQAISNEVRRRWLLRIAEAAADLPAPTPQSGYLAPTGLFLLMGLLVAQEAGCAAVVAEAGIGGASDDLSHWPLDTVVITQIFGEHLDILGPRVPDVARDKAGLIGARTRCVVSLPQSAEVAAEIGHRVEAVAAERRPAGGGAASEGTTAVVSPSAQAESLVGHLPEGYPRMNAAAGVTAALEMAALGNACPDAVARAVRSVQYPGRLSVHAAGQRRCVVDSAVSGDGLAAALGFTHRALGRDPDHVLVCLPRGKDLSGFIRVLEGFAGRKVFVEMPGAYIPMPDRGDWPWEWTTEAALPELLTAADGLVAGTVLFTSLALRTLGADATRLFTAA